MARLSIGEAWAASAETFRRDSQLMLPVALALVGLPGMVFSLMIPREQIEQVFRTGMPALWMLLFIPIFLIGILNFLVIAAMVLVPRVSVAEALGLGARRLPVLLAALALFFAAGMAAGFVAGAVAVLSTAAGALLAFAAMIAMAFVGVRLMLLPPLVVAERVGPVAGLRRAWALSAGSFWQLLGFLVIVVLVNLLIDIVVATAGSAVALLIGRLAGAPGVANFLGAAMAAIATSAVALLIAVMTANLYRQAAGGARTADG